MSRRQKFLVKKLQVFMLETTGLYSVETTGFYCQNYRLIFKLFDVDIVIVRISVYIILYSKT